jgi:hypothetical protein
LASRDVVSRSMTLEVCNANANNKHSILENWH